MVTSKYREDVKATLDGLLLGLPMVRAGKMFGYAAYYVKGKLFACVYGDGVGLKIPEQVANALLDSEGIIPFQPMGRNRMREWIQINRGSAEDYMDDIEILQTSANYVASLAK